MKRFISFAIIALLYAVAAGLAALMYYYLEPALNNANSTINSKLFAMLICDLAATIFIWAAGLLFKNVSVYDPYWSVAPPVIIIGWLLSVEGVAFNALQILLLVAVCLWSLRLTANWAYGFKGLEHEDWRYKVYRGNKLFHLINLFGFNLMPTLVVFVALIPAYFTISSLNNYNAGAIIGFIICVSAMLIQLAADLQLAKYRKTNTTPKAIMNTGLWKYSRHPNYLGEIMMWWGVYIMSIGNAEWFMFLGALPVTFLFIFVSIPMMEEHLFKKRPAYADYAKKTAMLIPFLKFKSDKNDGKNSNNSGKKR